MLLPLLLNTLVAAANLLLQTARQRVVLDSVLFIHQLQGDSTGVHIKGIMHPAAGSVVRLGSWMEIAPALGAPSPADMAHHRVCYGVLGSDAVSAHNCEVLGGEALFGLPRVRMAPRQGLAAAVGARFAGRFGESTAPRFASEWTPRKTAALILRHCPDGLAVLRQLPTATLYAHLERRTGGQASGRWERFAGAETPVRLFDDRLCSPPPPPPPPLPMPPVPPLPRRVLWSYDVHSSPMEDLRWLLAPLGVSFVMQSLKPTREMPQRHLPNHQQRAFDLLSKENLGSTWGAPRMGVMPPSEEDRRKVAAVMASDPAVASVDGFVCQYAASFCELLMALNRSLIVIANVRIEAGRVDHPDQFRRWAGNLRRIAASTRNVVAANNR